MCGKCDKMMNCINGAFCLAINAYVEHQRVIPCLSTDIVARPKCRQCIWRREMAFGIWCELHRKDTKDITECNNFDGGRK